MINNFAQMNSNLSKLPFGGLSTVCITNVTLEAMDRMVLIYIHLLRDARFFHLHQSHQRSLERHIYTTRPSLIGKVEVASEPRCKSSEEYFKIQHYHYFFFILQYSNFKFIYKKKTASVMCT